MDLSAWKKNKNKPVTFLLYLVGGWTNPFEKKSKWVHLPQIWELVMDILLCPEGFSSTELHDRQTELHDQSQTLSQGWSTLQHWGHLWILSMIGSQMHPTKISKKKTGKTTMCFNWIFLIFGDILSTCPIPARTWSIQQFTVTDYQLSAAWSTSRGGGSTTLAQACRKRANMPGS